MTIYLKQSTASQEVPLGTFVDSTDGNTEETALSVANTDIKLWKNGATTLANKNSGGATHISNGVYYCVLDATDTNTLGPLVIFVHVSGALPVRLECCVLAANVYDSLIAASDNLQVDAVQIEGSDATNQIRDAVVDDATRIDASALNTLAGHDPGETIMGATDLGAGAGLTSLASAANLATVAGYLDTEVAAIKGVTDKLDTALEDDGASGWQFTTLALENGPAGEGGGGLDAAGVRAAIGLAVANLDTQLGTIDSNVDAILVDTAEIGAAGAGLTAVPWNAAWDAEVQSEAADALTAYDPPTRAEATSDKDEILTAVADVPTNSELSTALAAADDAVLAAIAALNNLAAADVAGELATFFAANRAELAAPPAADASLIAKITWLAMLARNKVEQTASAQTVYADDEVTPVAEASVSDDGTTATRGEYAAP